MVFSSRVARLRDGFREPTSLAQVLFLLGAGDAAALAGAATAPDRSTPIDSPMLFSAGSCNAMPRMLSITCVIGGFDGSPTGVPPGGPPGLSCVVPPNPLT